MSNNKQSSVDWFAEQTLNAFITKEKYDELLEQAKTMHKQEIEKLEQEIKFLKTYIKMYETK